MTPRPEPLPFIEKNLDEDLLFQRLRKEGVSHIQDLCGKVWTDYNLHDPGITILEQCCYAMTEMAYRTGFDVVDILANEDNDIDYEALALYPPHEIFPGQALTPTEYENLIFDAIPEIENVWVEPIADPPGLYQVKIRASKEMTRSRSEKLIASVQDVFGQNRNLCEDLHGIKIVKNRFCRLSADVEISGRKSPANILAQIYYHCAALVSPGITYLPFDTLMAQEKSLDEIFTGPLLIHGFMDHTRKPRTPGFVNLADLLTRIRSIKGVVSVKSLYLEDKQTQEKFCDVIRQDGDGSVLCLELPEQEKDISVVLSKSSRNYRVSIKAFNQQYKGLESTHGKLGLSQEEIAKTRQLPQGRDLDLGQYHSIMDQFPNAYGINQFGVPSSYGDDRKAQAKQLKAYLLFFEQPMVNFMENLAAIPRLFSLDSDLEQASFSHLLDDTQAPDIEHLYVGGKKSCAANLDQVVKKYDDYYDRRNRVLDYLLALYGEKFTQKALGAFNYYFSESGLSRWFIRNKIKFLKYLPDISGKRSAGFNYCQPSWNSENISGLKLKVSVLLGFRFHQSRSLTIAFTKQGLELISDQDMAELNKGTSQIQFVDPSDVEERIKTPFQRVRLRRQSTPLRDRDIRRLFKQIIFLKNNFFNESFLGMGLDFNNFRIGRFSDNSWQLIAKPYGTARWCYLASFRTRRACLRAANHLRYFIKILNIMSEGLHLVEHLLLKPSGKAHPIPDLPMDYYTFRISVIFPSWPARCADKEFRKLAEETVRINAPAHIAVDIYWLGFQEMLEFEIIFHDWLENKRKGQGPETDELACRMLQFFIRYTHRKSRMAFL